MTNKKFIYERSDTNIIIPRPEWLWILIGVVASCGMGALMPIFAILFGDVLGVISYTDTEKARSV